MGRAPGSSLLLVSLLLTVAAAQHSKSQQWQNCTSISAGLLHQVRAGYWLSHSNQYSPVSGINASLYTHLYYSYLTLDPSIAAVIALPGPDRLPILSTFSTTLKSSNPSLKTLLSIATDDHQSDATNAALSSMAADPALRASFISTAIQLARASEFDGLDLAWQFPSSPEDMANLATLLGEWRSQIDGEAENSSLAPLLLTATVYFSNHLFRGSADNLYYPVDAMARNLDWVNALCFGFHKDNNVTALDAALFDRSSHFSASYGIDSWLDAGMPSCKLAMSIPLYGRSWFLKNKAKNGPGAAIVADGPKQKMSNLSGTMAYFEIEEMLKDPSSVYVHDSQTGSSYAHSGDLWVSYDGPEVIAEKIQFVLHSRLLGYFLWPISFDDPNQTASKQASDKFLQKYDSEHFEDEYGSEQAPSPTELQPQNNVPTPSAALSKSIQRFQPSAILHLDWYLLLFLLLYLVTK